MRQELIHRGDRVCYVREWDVQTQCHPSGSMVENLAGLAVVIVARHYRQSADYIHQNVVVASAVPAINNLHIAE